MKKILAILLVLVLALGMFTACGGGAKEEAPAEDTAAACNRLMHPAT